MLDQFLIAPIVEGMQTNIEPWLLPENAFAKLQNAYVWRGRIRKRFGATFILNSNAVDGFEQLQSRLRINIGSTNAGGDIAWGGSPLPGIQFKVGQMFSIGTDLFTVTTLGSANMITNSATATVFTFDTTNGHYTITGADVGGAPTVCYFYPAEPVMGFINYEVAAINDEPTYAFDTQFAYAYTAAGWVRLGTALWSGSNSQFFLGVNHRGATASSTLLFVTNNKPTDNIKYWDGATWNGVAYKPLYSLAATDTIDSCRLIVSFKGRLLFLNTWETLGAGASTNYKNRVRYSKIGSPLDADSFVEGEYTSGRGGFLDATTKEAIISAKILRDRLIVFFERSTWELVDTGNSAKPFVFQKVNSELGVESTFSTVLFDKVLLGIGNVGIHACNGANVERIDERIPQEVFRFHNGSDGIERVYGIRDYYTEMVYWSIPGQENNPTFPTKVLVYNYIDKTWSMNDDSITCFGYIQNLDDETWAIIDGEWQDNQNVWNSGVLQSKFRKVIAGNQEGYTFLIDGDMSRNAPVLQISQLSNLAGVVTVTSVNHNLFAGDYVLIENVLGNDASGPPPNPVDMKVDGVYKVLTVGATDTFTINEPLFTGTYSGAGTISRVSIIDIKTKAYNFYQKQGGNLFIPKVEYYVDNIESGQIMTDYYTSDSSLSMVDEGETSNAAFGTSILETAPYPDNTMEATQKKFWHTIYLQAEGETIQLHLYISDAQLAREADSSNKDAILNIAVSDFRLNAINIYSRMVNR